MLSDIIIKDLLPEITATPETETAFFKFKRIYEISNSRAPDRYKLDFKDFL